MPSLKRRRRKPPFSINHLVPNAVTLAALAAGLTAVRLALQERWELAVVAVVVAMVLDALDGRIARLMKATSDFGAQLDSLSDVINFGVAPALIIYLWTAGAGGGPGWAISVVYAMCCALRLARFNTALLDESPPPWAAKFFTGVPAPAGAGLAILPLVFSFVFGDSFFRSPWLTGIVLLATAGLMVSRVPTFAAKTIKIQRRYMGFVLLGVGAFAAFLVSEPWVTLAIVGLVYIASIPFSATNYRRIIKAAAAAGELDQDPGPDTA